MSATQKLEELVCEKRFKAIDDNDNDWEQLI